MPALPARALGKGAELAVPAEFESQGDFGQGPPMAEPFPAGSASQGLTHTNTRPRGILQEKSHGCSQKSFCGSLLHPSSFGDTCGDRAGDRDSPEAPQVPQAPSALGVHTSSRDRSGHCRSCGSVLEFCKSAPIPGKIMKGGSTWKIRGGE